MKPLLSIIVSTVAAQHGAPETCYTCAESEDSYFCQWGGLLGNGLVACCDSNSVGDAFCTEGLGNLCSPTKKQSGNDFYDYCPGAFNADICGPSTLTATPTKTSFKLTDVHKDLASADSLTALKHKTCVYEI